MEDLVGYFLNLELSFFGLSTTKLGRLVYQLTGRYKLQYHFNREKEIAFALVKFLCVERDRG